MTIEKYLGGKKRKNIPPHKKGLKVEKVKVEGEKKMYLFLFM